MRTSISAIEKRVKEAEKYNRPLITKEAVEEVKKILEELEKEYNSPEAEAKRKAEYEEVCRIGKLREGAFSRGEPMDKYPLPWESQEGIKKRIEEHEKNKMLIGCWWTQEEWEEERDELHQELQRRIELDEFYAKEGETRNEPRNKEF